MAYTGARASSVVLFATLMLTQWPPAQLSSPEEKPTAPEEERKAAEVLEVVPPEPIAVEMPTETPPDREPVKAADSPAVTPPTNRALARPENEVAEKEAEEGSAPESSQRPVRQPRQARDSGGFTASGSDTDTNSSIDESSKDSARRPGAGRSVRVASNGPGVGFSGSSVADGPEPGSDDGSGAGRGDARPKTVARTPSKVGRTVQASDAHEGGKAEPRPTVGRDDVTKAELKGRLRAHRCEEGDSKTIACGDDRSVNVHCDHGRYALGSTNMADLDALACAANNL